MTYEQMEMAGNAVRNDIPSVFIITEANEMTGVVKICKVHGKLAIEQVTEREGKNKTGYRCVDCCNEQNIVRQINVKLITCKIHGKLNDDDYYYYLGKGKKTPIFRCRICNRKSANLSKRNRREEVNEWQRDDRKKKPELYAAQKRRFVEKKGKDKVNDYEICRRLKFDIEKYREMFRLQDNKCAICGMEETREFKGKKMRLTLDHCHSSNKIRELLCHNCNTGIGKFSDSIELMEKAILYLKRHE